MLKQKTMPTKQKFSCKINLYKHFLSLEKYLYNIQKAIYYDKINKLQQDYFSKKLQKKINKFLLQKKQTLEYGVKKQLTDKTPTKETINKTTLYYKMFRKEFTKPLLSLDKWLQEKAKVLETIKVEIIEEFLYQKNSLVCKQQCNGGIVT